MQRSGSCRRPMALSRFSRRVRILGIESSCDETAAAVVEDGEAVLSSVVASQMIHPRQVRRRGPGAGLARAPARHRARGARSSRALRHQARRPRRHRRHRGTGPGGFAAGGPHLRQIAELRQRRAAHRRQPHRGPHSRRGSGSPARRNARGIPRRGAGGERRPHAPVRSPRGVRVPPARQNARRRRGRGLRQSGQAPGLLLPRRPGRRPAFAAMATPRPCASPSPR